MTGGLFSKGTCAIKGASSGSHHTLKSARARMMGATVMFQNYSRSSHIGECYRLSSPISCGLQNLQPSRAIMKIGRLGGALRMDPALRSMSNA